MLQQDILNCVAALIANRLLRSTITKRVDSICAETLKSVHAEIEAGGARGKIVLDGW